VLPYGASTYSKSAVAFGPEFPVQATHGDGWRIFVNGKDLCDCVMGLGSVILGHRNSVVDDAIRRQLSLGTTLSLSTDIEHEAAERVLRHFPAGYSLQWGVNGSDATTGAIRLARAVTGKNIIAMFDDGYHGFHDWSLSGTERGYGIPPQGDSEGYPLVHRIGNEGPLPIRNVAAVIIEPDLHSDQLKPLRQWCTENNALLIFDEVMTWARYPEWRAAKYFDVEPDLTCIGKSLGNGMPVSAIVGSADILKRFAPSDIPNAFFSSTWAGHPLSMAAVIATLDVLEQGVGETDRDGPSWLWEQAKYLNSYLRNRMQNAGWATIGDPPWNRVQSPWRVVMDDFRQTMLRHGVLIYGAHNLSLAQSQPAWERLFKAWDVVIEGFDLDSLQEVYGDPEPVTGVMRR
jgi:glutamate-1-semialdehyde aminotransferase